MAADSCYINSAPSLTSKQQSKAVWLLLKSGNAKQLHIKDGMTSCVYRGGSQIKKEKISQDVKDTEM